MIKDAVMPGNRLLDEASLHEKGEKGENFILKI